MNVVIPANVETPITFKVFARTSAVEPPPAAAVTVTDPPEIADTLKLFPKLIVPAVPTNEPLSLITTPDPEATIPDNEEPSPTNLVAVTIPVIFTLPVPVIDLLNKSKLPPS